MKWISTKSGFADFGILPNILPWLTALMMVGFGFGCARNVETSAPPPSVLKADGVSAAGAFRAVVIEDVDNDGNLDIVGGASSPAMVTISYGDGRGGITDPLYLPTKGQVRSVAVADINEDGLADVIFSVQKESSGIRAFLNQPNRRWKLRKGPIEINRYEGIETADINGDGHLDIIAANATSVTQGGIQVWLGDGKGNWPVETGPTISGIYMDVLAADINQDGNPDIVGAGWGTYGAIRVWLGDGTGKWSSTEPLEKGSFYGLSIGDLNADGNFDILSGSYRRGVRIFLGDGRGDFSRIRSPAEVLERRTKGQKQTTGGVGQLSRPQKDRSFWQVLALDLDDDGRDDILAGSLDSQGISAWRSLGKEGWSTIEGDFPSTGNYYGMALADLNSNDRLDICAASYGEGIKIWPGKDGHVNIIQPESLDRSALAGRPAEKQATLENTVFKTINGVSEYKIDPGDILEISLWEGNKQVKEEIAVRPDGNISFGFVEDLHIKGLTASELDKKLTLYLKEYVKNPRIDVVVKKYNSKWVRVLGAVAAHGRATDSEYLSSGPGSYSLRGKTTALEILTTAGGPKENANLKNVRFRRKNGESSTLNLYKAILQGDRTQNPVLDDGDLVFLPTISETGNRVYVFGEVEKPGAYTFTGSEIRLLDIISEAGGATVNAAEYKTRVVRGDETKPEIIAANIRSLVEQGDRSQNVALVDGDLVYVPRNGIGNVNRFVEQIFPSLRALATATSIVVNFDTINAIVK